MHHIVFDTNVLRNEYFHSPRMKKLKRLIDEGLVQIYIPEIVKKEFLTQKLLEFQGKLKSKDIIDVDRFFVTDSNSVKDKLSEVEKVIKEVYSDIENLIETEFDDWVSEYTIKILPFNNSKMTEVMDNYFTGGAVFKSIKNRQDIPDAMICTTIEELSYEVGNLNVLIHDTAFKEHLNTIQGINIFSTTKNLLENQAIESDLNILDKRNDKFELLYSYLRSALFHEKLGNYLITATDVIDELYLETENVLNMEILGKYVFYCILESAESSTVSDLKINKVELADDNEYFLNVNFIAKGSLRFGTEYSEYMLLEKDENRNIEYYNMKGDGATSVDENRFLEFHGVLIINVKDIESDNPEELLDYDSITIDVDKASILPLHHNE